jgi:hypothetical protein
METHGYTSFRWLKPRLKSWEETETLCKSVGRKLSVRKIFEEHKP